MPTINRQSPTAKPKPKPTGGSLLSQVVPVSEIDNQFLKFCVYGQNRVGKTHLSCTFPKPLLLIAFEPNLTGGALTVRKVPGVDYIRIQSVKDAMALAEELRTGNRWKTHVLDGATSLGDVILKELLNLDAVPEQLDWGTVSEDVYRQRSEKTREVLRPFLNLPAHTVVLAKERDHNAFKGNRKPKMLSLKSELPESFFGSDVGGATAGWLHDACDYVARLFIDKEYKTRTLSITNPKTKVKTEKKEEYETGRNIRKLRCLYHTNFAAGFRSADPSKVPEILENPDFDKIWQIIKGDD